MTAEGIESLSTATQTVTLRTRRGHLRVGPHGRLDGLWRIVSRELRSNAEVRAMCRHVERRGGRPSSKPVERGTLLYWRKHLGFPKPVVKLDGVDYWSRTEVEAWIEARARPDDLARR
jgi:hypothetical protein